MKLTRRIGCSAALFMAAIFIAAPTVAQDKAPTQVLVTNVRVFDGTSDKLTGKTNVLVENNLIKEISPDAKAGTDATVIDGGGRVLMPGLIEAHGHLAPVQNPVTIFNNNTWDYVGALMNEEAKRYLMRGFTTLRDLGGPDRDRRHRVGNTAFDPAGWQAPTSPLLVLGSVSGSGDGSANSRGSNHLDQRNAS